MDVEAHEESVDEEGSGSRRTYGRKGRSMAIQVRSTLGVPAGLAGVPRRLTSVTTTSAKSVTRMAFPKRADTVREMSRSSSRKTSNKSGDSA